MARTKGTLNLSGTLEVKAGGPLDARSLVPTLADLTTAANFPYPYVGMETYVVAENKKYRLIATPVTSSSNWEEVGSGGGGGGEDGGKMLTGTLLAASWSSKAQTVSVTGLKSDTIGAIGILNTATAAQAEAAREAVITPTTLANGTISFTCENVPSVDIPFGVMIPGGGSGSGDDPDAYKTTDATETTFADDDKIPFYDTSASGKRNSSWANIKSVLKTYFDDLYSTVKSRLTPSLGSSTLSLVTRDDMAQWYNKQDNFIVKTEEMYFDTSGTGKRLNLRVPVTTAEKNTWNGKQDALTAGTGITIDSNNVISSSGTSIVANQFDKANIYSTTEKIVGCWTDGRPIYQKVIDFGAGPNATAKSVEHGVSNISTVVKMLIVATSGTGSSSGGSLVSFALDSATLNSSGQKTFSFLQADKITIRSDIDQSAKTFKIILLYTKTTDAANSFNYADENDYSTTEHIVGTWTDGKPVYQKVVFSTPGVTTDSIALTLPNLKTIIKVDIYGESYVDGDYYRWDGRDNGPYWINNVYHIKSPDQYATYKIILQYTKTTD